MKSAGLFTISAAKGVPLDYIILGCLQPGQSSSLYADAVRVASDKLHYLSFSGDGSTAEVFNIIREELKRVTNMNTKCLFDAVHCFTPHADIPDDSKLRLVFLEPNNYYSSNGDLHLAEAVPIRNNGSSYMQSIEDVCIEHEVVIRKWAPVHYNNQLTAIYWKNNRKPLSAMKIWDDMMRYLYFPRLQNEGVYESVFRACSSVPDYFATAQGKNDDDYIGLQVGKEIFQLDDELLIVPLEMAKAQLEKTQAPAADIGRIQQPGRPEPVSVTDGNGKIKEEEPAAVSPVTSVQERKYMHLFAEIEIKPLLFPACVFSAVSFKKM